MGTPSRGEPLCALPVRVLSLKRRESATVLFLGCYRGVWTHYAGGQTILCPGPDRCTLPGHGRLKRFWKGYAAGEIWREKEDLWLPVIVEITSTLEERLRGRTLRGEVWTLTRKHGKKATTPLLGEFLTTIGPPILSPAFDLEAPLKRFFGVETLGPDVENPAIPQLCLPPVRRPGPPDPLAADVSVAESDQREAWRLWQQERDVRHGNVPPAGSPMPSVNGKPKTPTRAPDEASGNPTDRPSAG
jgi:hypothetical protein